MTVLDRPPPAFRLASTEAILADARAGRMFILVDAEDRENEGDLVLPAAAVSAETINFMATHGRGLICLAITEARARALNLELMARANQSRHSTAFTVSIEAREGITTGISAQDRALTIAVAADEQRDARDIVSPGHVFPLVAREGGVLVRAGHTEAAVDIARLAGHAPAGVICEVMSADGTMARLPELMRFAAAHGLNIGTIADLIAYRRQHDTLVRVVDDTALETPHGKFRARIFLSEVDGREHIALTLGDLTASPPVLVRMHAKHTLDNLRGGAAYTSARSALLFNALAAIAVEGRGAAIILRESGRAISAALAAERDGAGAEARVLLDYGIGAQILRALGVRDLILLSNTPLPKVPGLEGHGLAIVGQRRLGT